MAVTFIPAFTTNAMTSDFLLLISHGWVVTFQDSHPMVFTFRSWLDLLDVVLAFWISMDLVYKLRRVKDTPNFISSGSKIVKRLRRRQYDPLIIETTIGLVLGPCTALCRLFLQHCTLTNKAVGTIWRALSKPPQRRQGPDLRPLWLLVGTPSAIRPELAFSRAEHSLSYSDVTIYIFAILYLSPMPYV